MFDSNHTQNMEQHRGRGRPPGSKNTTMPFEPKTRKGGRKVSESRKKKQPKKKGKRKSLRDSSDDPLMSGSDDEEAAEDSAEDSSNGEQGWNLASFL